MTCVLVTGAAGFIGSHLCESLLRHGCQVRGLDALTTFYDPRRKQRNLARLLGSSGFEFVAGDLLTTPLHGLLDDVSAVAHLAGEPGVTTSWGPGFERYLDRNVLATQRLLETARERGVRRFVYASSSSVYGDGNDALRARGEPRPASPYGVSKLAAEALVGAYASSFGLRTVSLRYFSVYGPRQRPDMAAYRFIEALLDGRALTLFGDGMQARDFTFVDDVVEATRRALSAELPPAAVLDIAGGRAVTVNAVIDQLRELIGSEASPVDRCDERPGDVARTEGRLRAAHEYLDWVPEVDLRTGLLRQVRWHRALRIGRLSRSASMQTSDGQLVPLFGA